MIRNRFGSRSRRARHSLVNVARAIECLEGRLLLTASPNGDDLRTYRLAVAATEEYTAAFNNDRTQAQQAIQDAVDNINLILNRDLNVHLDLIDDLSIIFGPGNSPDPFSTDKTAAISQNQTLLDNTIGSANYDLGHVFGTFSGGFASLASLGVDGRKARGASGRNNSTPAGEAFELIVAHEFGHQIGAEHSFNGVAGFCNEREADSAFEPGSGTTIMSYAGICPAVFQEPPLQDNIQNDPDPYFHANSIDEMVAHLLTLDGSVGTIQADINNIPTVSAGVDRTIPAQTPFFLTAINGVDADDPTGQSLTYTWEQMDLGPAQTISPASDNGQSPLFRSFSPAASPSGSEGTFTRMFPQQSDILTNTQTKGEFLPTTNRSLNFRVTVRDGVGGVNGDDVTLTVIDTDSPFQVTSTNTPTLLTGGNSHTVTWDVGGTDANGINTSTVEIMLSTDGGLTFPHLLATTNNDGSHSLSVPNIDTTSARFKVAAVGNIFFDVSDAATTIQSNPAAPGITLTETDGNTLVGEGLLVAPTTDTYNLALNTTPSSAVDVTVTASDQARVSLDGTSFQSSVTFTRSDTSPQTITVQAVNDADVEGLHTTLITQTVSSSSDPNYPVGLVVNDLMVQLVDDERPPLVAVDLQDDGSGGVPANWTEIDTDPSIFSATTFSDLIREDGTTSNFDVTITPQSGSTFSFGGSSIDDENVPIHEPSLSDADGVLMWLNSTSTNTVTATWSDLTPGDTYNVYMMAVENFGGGLFMNQTVTITGDGTIDPAPFVQNSDNQNRVLNINGEDGDNTRTLESFALPVVADGNGEILVSVSRNDGVDTNRVYISALAIQPVIAPTSGSTSIDFDEGTGTLTVSDQDATTISISSSGGASGLVIVTIDGQNDTSFGNVQPEDVQSILVQAGGNDNTIDLSAVTSTAYTNAGGISVEIRGGAGDDIITGSGFNDMVFGEDGADQLTAAQDGDALDGGAGDDTLTVNSTSFTQAFGGAGSNDTLVLNAGGVMFDIRSVASSTLDDVETLHIDGNGANILTLDPNRITNLSDQSSTVIVDGGADDTVNIREGWTAAGTEMINGNQFNAFTSSGTTLKVRSQSLPAPVAPVAMMAETSTVDVDVSGNFDLTTLNLFDGSDANVDTADVTLMGDTVGAIVGSLLIDQASQQVTFVKTGDPLARDSYTLTFISGEDAFKTVTDGLFDGDADGLPGGDLSFAFTVAEFNGRTLIVPDFTRGPGQDVQLGGSTGIPISVDDADSLTSVSFTMNFDSNLMNVTSASLASGLPADWQINVDVSNPGSVVISASGTSALTTGERDLVIIDADIPSSATYGSSSIMGFSGIQLNGGTISGRGDEGILNTIFVADADGSQTYSILDAIQVARAAFQLDSGFDTFDLIDPFLVGNTDTDTNLSILDAIGIARKAFGLPQANIPDLPGQATAESPAVPTEPIPGAAAMSDAPDPIPTIGQFSLLPLQQVLGNEKVERTEERQPMIEEEELPRPRELKPIDASFARLEIPFDEL
ncbi:MAG: hypothetical protein CMJ78_14460 [Planctomycetaceae bacterium]|nr:hypothetical protein [Planctomycetaceae bacterium]